MAEVAAHQKYEGSLAKFEVTNESRPGTLAEVPTQRTRAGSPAKAWEAISQWLPSRGPESDYWWKLTGPHLATMMDAAGYAIEKQYEALVFHYHWIVSCALNVSCSPQDHLI